MDQLEEKSSVLARTGSFYYRSLPEKPKNEANFMSHLSWQTKLFNLGNISQNLVLSGGYSKGNFRILRFEDKDIDYFGLESAIQHRVVAYVQETELMEVPLHAKINPEWDYTRPDTVMEVTWSQVDLGSDIIVPEGVLKRVDLTVPEGQTVSGYMSLLVKNESGSYVVEAVSSSAGVLRDGKMRWLFKDVRLTGNAIRVLIKSDADVQSTAENITSVVNHLDNESSVRAGTSVVEGVVPELVFFLRGASVIENAVTARPANLTISAVAGVMNNEGDIIADSSEVILFPTGDSANSATYTGAMRFGLSVDPDIWVTSIQTEKKRLIAGYDFVSEFGKLVFTVNPIQLFPDMTLMAYSFIERTRNLYSYSLRLDDVYGPVDRVMHYYRVSQSPRAFYLAAAQAAGFAVVREECVVQEILPFQSGYIYVTDKGTYEAPYQHSKLDEGAVLESGTVIGGNELFRLLLPTDPWPSNIDSLNMDGILPVKGLKAPDRAIRVYDAEGNYRPAYTGSQEALQAYWNYLQKYSEQSSAAQPAEWLEYTPVNPNAVNANIAAGFNILGYTPGQHSWEIQVRVNNYSAPVSTGSVIALASDYYLMSQEGAYFGLSSSASSMQGSSDSWPVPDSTENGVNTWTSTSKLYGWISRAGNGAQGIANVLDLTAAVITIRYNVNSDSFLLEIKTADPENPITERVIISGYNPTPGTIVFNSLSGTLLSLKIQDKFKEVNAIQHVRGTVCAGKLLLACINYNKISATMKLRLETFMQRELPVGSVLTTIDMPGTIS